MWKFGKCKKCDDGIVSGRGPGGEPVVIACSCPLGERHFKVIEPAAEEPPAPRPTDHELRFAAWLGAKPWSEIQMSHYRALYQIAFGKRDPAPGISRAEAMATLAGAGAPVTLDT